MESDNGLTLDFQPIGSNGRARLTARLNGNAIYTDKADLCDATDRKRFIRDLRKRGKGIDQASVAAELEKIAGEIVAKGGDENADKRRPSQADILVELAEAAELFHTPGGHDSEGYATVQVGDHRETWPIASRGFRRWLSRLYYLESKKVPGSQAVQDAVCVLAGMAVHGGPEIPVALRVAEQAGSIYLDLADSNWRSVEITAAGWRIVDNPQVRFVRRRGMLALPVPLKDGSVDDLRPLVNVPDDDQWRLLIGWLIAALRPGRPFPVLVVNGEQGSAKSTLCKMARALIDPNEAALRRPPRDVRDLMIAANNSWVIGFDNLSGLSAELSDAICSLATGSGFATRELYSDAEEKLFSATRPVMINGIEELATRSDLLDRSIGLTLLTINDDLRQEEDHLWGRFRAAQPRILGSLLDATCAAIANKPGVTLTSKPRMADFASWVIAAEPALKWPDGAFLAAYVENRAAANSQVLDESLLVPLILKIIEGKDGWRGTASDLLVELESHADERIRKRRDWPATPRKLSGDLRRLAPNLRRGAGVEVRFDRDHGRKRQRLICLDWIGKTPSVPSATVRSGPVRPDGRTVADGTDDDLPTQSGRLMAKAVSGLLEPTPEEEIVEWTS